MPKSQRNLGFNVCFGIKVKLNSYGEVEIYLHSFLISALSGASVQPHVPAVLPAEKYSPMPID